jgi:phospholipid/cholesterol/gamma-HCH transport system permease protein
VSSETETQGARRAGADPWSSPWIGLVRFGARALRRALSASTYNGASLEVVQKQIYFTAWEILPGFAAFVALLCLVIIQIVGSTAKAFGLYGYALELVIRVLALEVLPLLTAVFVALRTGAAMSTEVALMKIHNELEAFELIGVDPLRFELIPRVIGGTIAVLALTAVAIVVALGLAHLVIVDFQPWSLPQGDFARAVGKVFDLPAMLLLWTKTFAFGLAVTVIPISQALATPKRLSYAPVTVLRGMVRLFFAVMTIEVVALALAYVV